MKNTRSTDVAASGFQREPSECSFRVGAIGRLACLILFCLCLGVVFIGEKKKQTSERQEHHGFLVSTAEFESHHLRAYRGANDASLGLRQ